MRHSEAANAYSVALSALTEKQENAVENGVSLLM
jgi:hypothetical protein